MTDVNDKQDVENEEEDTVTTQDKNEKTLTQSEVNKLLAAERRKMQQKLDAITNEYTTFKTSVEEKEQAEEEKNKKVVDELRKGLPTQVTKLLDKLTVSEQLEWLNDPENKIEKKRVPQTPQGNEDERLPAPEKVKQYF